MKSKFNLSQFVGFSSILLGLLGVYSLASQCTSNETRFSAFSMVYYVLYMGLLLSGITIRHKSPLPRIYFIGSMVMMSAYAIVMAWQVYLAGSVVPMELMRLFRPVNVLWFSLTRLCIAWYSRVPISLTYLLHYGLYFISITVPLSLAIMATRIKSQK
ncbi:MAG: hypothetical protein KDC86_19530 [Saprospiraceae bacterium]|nr:hypothetical protein [Saprospiraceae bacterium]